MNIRTDYSLYDPDFKVQIPLTEYQLQMLKELQEKAEKKSQNWLTKLLVVLL